MKERARTIVGNLAVACLVMVVCFAVFNAVFAGMLSIILLTVAVEPFRSRWDTWEVATTLAWLFGVIVMYTNVLVDGLVFLFFLSTGVLLGISWLFRDLIRATRPSKHDGVRFPLVPAALLLAWILFQTDVDLRVRLALSEPALRADLRRIRVGHKEDHRIFPRRVGLFWTDHVEENQGCVFWTTGGFFMNYHGLAYIPGDLPTKTSYDFRQIRGPWWAFEFDF